jgi:hypothetical protein
LALCKTKTRPSSSRQSNHLSPFSLWQISRWRLDIWGLAKQSTAIQFRSRKSQALGYFPFALSPVRAIEIFRS